MWCGRKGIDCQYSGEFGECHRSACCNTTTEKSMDDIKREAVKEFAEKLKSRMIDSEYMGVHYKQAVFSKNDIDELLKEYENEH